MRVSTAPDYAFQLHHNDEHTPDSSTIYYNATFLLGERLWDFVLYTTPRTGDVAGGIAAGTIFLALALAVGCGAVYAMRGAVASNKSRRVSRLLSLVFPAHISDTLIESVRTLGDGSIALAEGDTMIAQAHSGVSLCFIDICDFTVLARCVPPRALVQLLDEFVTVVDNLADCHAGVIKIKTIGDAYFAVAGLDDGEQPLAENARLPSSVRNLLSLLEFCCDVQDAFVHHRFTVTESASLDYNELHASSGSDSHRQARASSEDSEALRCKRASGAFVKRDSVQLRIRIGVHFGNVVAGVIGKHRPVRRLGVLFCALTGCCSRL